MTAIVITGGIATGKSSLVRQLAGDRADVTVFDADRSVHRLLTLDPVVRRVVEAFGSQVLDAGGRISRDTLRHLVLSDPSRRLRLEAILHPLVHSECVEARERAAHGGAAAFLADIPLYFEARNFEIDVDCVVVVACRRATQLARLVAGRGLDAAGAAAFVDAQFPLTEKMNRADHVVWNDGTPDVLAAQGRLLRAIVRL